MTLFSNEYVDFFHQQYEQFMNTCTEENIRQKNGMFFESLGFTPSCIQHYLNFFKKDNDINADILYFNLISIDANGVYHFQQLFNQYSIETNKHYHEIQLLSSLQVSNSLSLRLVELGSVSLHKVNEIFCRSTKYYESNTQIDYDNLLMESFEQDEYEEILKVSWNGLYDDYIIAKNIFALLQKDPNFENSNSFWTNMAKKYFPNKLPFRFIKLRFRKILESGAINILLKHETVVDQIVNMEDNIIVIEQFNETKQNIITLDKELLLQYYISKGKNNMKSDFLMKLSFFIQVYLHDNEFYPFTELFIKLLYVQANNKVKEIYQPIKELIEWLPKLIFFVNPTDAVFLNILDIIYRNKLYYVVTNEVYTYFEQ